MERHSTQYSFLSFLHIVRFFPSLSSPLFTSPCVSAKRVRQRKKKREKRERNRRPSLLQGDNNSFFFYLPSEGPDDSSGRARWMKRKVCVRVRVCLWGQGGWGAYQGTRHRYLLETARRCLCASENSHSHC